MENLIPLLERIIAIPNRWLSREPIRVQKFLEPAEIISWNFLTRFEEKRESFYGRIRVKRLIESRLNIGSLPPRVFDSRYILANSASQLLKDDYLLRYEFLGRIPREREREALNNFLTRFFLGTTFAKLITRHGPHNEFTSREQKFLWHVLVLSRSFSEDKETLGHRSFLLPLKQSWGSNSTSSFTRSSFCVYTFSKCLSVSARERKQFPLFLFPDLKNFHP